jgi:hypothetical protein
MYREITGRTVALIAALCLAALVISCASAGLAVHQRLLDPPEIDATIGTFHIVTMAYHPVICLGGPDTSTNACYNYQSVYAPRSYRIWLFTSSRQRGVQTTHVLLRLNIPLREAAAN